MHDVSWTNGMLFMVGVWLEYLSKNDQDFSIPRINKWVFSWCAAKHSFSRKRKKEKSFFTTSPTHCSEMLLNLKPKSHFWLYKRYKCLNFLDAWICLIIDFMYFIHCLGQCYWLGLRTVLWQGEQQENMSFVGVSKTSREKKYANTKADWKSFQTFFMKKSRWEG